MAEELVALRQRSGGGIAAPAEEFDPDGDPGVERAETGLPEDWIRLHLEPIRRFVGRRLGREFAGEAEDVVQQTILSALQAFHRFRGEGSIRTWLLSIARFKSADAIRGTVDRRTRTHSEPDLDRRTATVQTRGVGGPRARTMRRVVRRALMKLKGSQRHLLVLKYMLGLSVAEVARDLGRTKKSVEGRLFRARRAYRAALRRESERLGLDPREVLPRCAL